MSQSYDEEIKELTAECVDFVSCARLNLKRALRCSRVLELYLVVACTGASPHLGCNYPTNVFELSVFLPVYEYVVTFDQEVAAVWAREKKFAVGPLLLLSTRWCMVALAIASSLPADTAEVSKLNPLEY